MTSCLNAHLGFVRTFNYNSLRRCTSLGAIGRIIASWELNLLVPRNKLPDLDAWLANGISSLHQISHTTARFHHIQLWATSIHSYGALLGRCLLSLPLWRGNRWISPVDNGHELSLRKRWLDGSLRRYWWCLFKTFNRTLPSFQWLGKRPWLRISHELLKVSSLLWLQCGTICWSLIDSLVRVVVV